MLTDDGVRIEAAYEPWAGGQAAADGGSAATGEGASGDTDGRAVDGTGSAANRPAIVIAHGFTGSLDRPAVQRAARAFTQHAAVVTFSFRGHGRSGGRSTVGDREVLDLAAAVRWARSLGHARVATVGFSMGGSVVLRHAALYLPDGSGGADTAPGGLPETGPAGTPASPPRGGMSPGGRTEAHTDAVAAVSAPARWYYRGTAPMRRLHWVISRPAGRLIGRYGLRTRIHSKDWDPVPLSPVEAAPLIAPTPMLIVHGDRDPYFPLDHPRSLADAADGAAELWIEQGMGHAENAADPQLLRRIADWLVPAR
ncbi:alpha/beta hydrolase [Streptomyces sp. NPDC004647]|uniref:alpha/beta hydrolase n=1 Tax=Streptomyces sp. NPDC004647 TaxID=3154671 RepID=UPI0033B55498